MSSQWPFPSASLTKSWILCIYLSPRVPHFAPITSSIWSRTAQTMKLFIMQLSPSSCHLLPHRPKHHVGPCSSLTVKDQISYPHKTKVQVTILYTAISMSHTQNEITKYSVSTGGLAWWQCTTAINCTCKGGYTLVTLPRSVTLYRDSVDGTRARVTYQKSITR